MNEIKLKISGMMCGGCENRVRNALKEIDGVDEVLANYKDGSVIIKCAEKIDESAIKEKIEDIGYEVVEE